MSHQLLVWFGDVDGWPHEGHDTESPSPSSSPTPPPSHLAFDILQLSAIRSQCLELPTGCRIWFMDATITPTAPMHRCLFQIFFSIMLEYCWKWIRQRYFMDRIAKKCKPKIGFALPLQILCLDTNESAQYSTSTGHQTTHTNTWLPSIHTQAAAPSPTYAC